MRLLHPPSSARSRAGGALVAALAVVVLIAAFAMMSLHASSTRFREATVSADVKRAFYIAEAGLSEAYQGLRIGKSGNVGSDELPARFGNGVFWVVAEQAGSGRLALKSTGLCGSGRASLSVVVENTSGSVAALGVFTGQEMVVRPGCTIDSYDSTLGSYDQQESGSDARVGSNADISVQGSLAAPTTIKGDVSPGPTGTLVRQPGVKITGSTAPRDAPAELPPITPPEIESKTKLVYSNKTTPLAIDGGDRAWSELRVTSGSSATIFGPATIVADRLVIDAGASLSIDSSAGPVTIYVREQLDLQTGSKLATPYGSPATVTLLVSASASSDFDGDGVVDPPATLAAAGRFNGTIYAPDAALTLPGSLELFGAVSARSLVIDTGARVHFDRALTAASAGAQIPPNTLCWRIVELPPVPLVRQRRDPIAALAKLGIVPIDAPAAHFDIGVVPPTNDPGVTPFVGGLIGSGTLANGAGAPPEVVPPATAAALARIDDASVGSSQLRDDLIAAMPLDAVVLEHAIDRSPAMNSSHLRDVLMAAGTLPLSVLRSLVNGSSPLSSGDLKSVLRASSPLPPSILAAVTAHLPPLLSPSDLLSVLAAQ